MPVSIKEQVDAILSQQGPAKQWGQREHVHLIAKLAQDVGLAMGIEDKPITSPEFLKEFKAVLAYAGIGGNASQFRQLLEKKGLIPASAKALDDYQ